MIDRPGMAKVDTTAIWGDTGEQSTEHTRPQIHQTTPLIHQNRTTQQTISESVDHRPTNRFTQYNRNLQRIFSQEAGAAALRLHLVSTSCDENKELLSPTESDTDDLVEDKVDLVHHRLTQSRGLLIEPDQKRELVQKHFTSSPYKEILVREDDHIWLCPDSWFQTPANDPHQSSFLRKLFWKGCFLCCCLPLCYPCYLSRTYRDKSKDSHSGSDPGDLICAGQLEVGSTLSSKRSTIHSKHSTLPIKHSTGNEVNIIPTKSSIQNRELSNSNHSTLETIKEDSSTPEFNIDVLIIQSGSSKKIIKSLQQLGLLSKIKQKRKKKVNNITELSSLNVNNNNTGHYTSDIRNSTDNVLNCKKGLNQDQATNQGIEDSSEEAHSPVTLRRELNRDMIKSMSEYMSFNESTKSSLVAVHNSSSFGSTRKSRMSELFFSLGSNLDLIGTRRAVSASHMSSSHLSIPHVSQMPSLQVSISNVSSDKFSTSTSDSENKQEDTIHVSSDSKENSCTEINDDDTDTLKDFVETTVIDTDINLNVTIDHEPNQTDNLSNSPDEESKTGEYISRTSDHEFKTPYHVSIPPDHVSIPPDHVSTPPDHKSQTSENESLTPDHESQTPDYMSTSPQSPHLSINQSPGSMTVSSLPSVTSSRYYSASDTPRRSSTCPQVMSDSVEEHVEPVIRVVENSQDDSLANTFSVPLERKRKMTVASIKMKSKMSLLRKSMSMTSSMVETRVRRSLGVRSVGSHTLLTDTGYRIRQMIHEEEDLVGWTASDIYNMVNIPDIDVVVLVVDKAVRVTDLLTRTTGMVGYIREYWAGFYPLLLVELDDINLDSKIMASLASSFSVVYRVKLGPNIGQLLETVARFYTHTKVFQCDKFHQLNEEDNCPGLCRLKREYKEDGLEEKRQGLLQSMKRSLLVKSILDYQWGGLRDSKT